MCAYDLHGQKIHGYVDYHYGYHPGWAHRMDLVDRNRFNTAARWIILCVPRTKKWWFNGDLMVIYWDFYGNLMGFNGIYWDLLGYMMVYPLVICYIAIEMEFMGIYGGLMGSNGIYPLVNYHNYGKSPCSSWVNQLFLWSFSIAM